MTLPKSTVAAINWRVRSNSATGWPRIWCAKTSTIGWTPSLKPWLLRFARPKERRCARPVLGGTGKRSSPLRIKNQRQKFGNRENGMSSSEDPEPRPVIPARQARQGVTGHNVRLVLGFSIVAVVIALAIIWMVYFA